MHRSSPAARSCHSSWLKVLANSNCSACSVEAAAGAPIYSDELIAATDSRPRLTEPVNQRSFDFYDADHLNCSLDTLEQRKHNASAKARITQTNSSFKNALINPPFESMDWNNAVYRLKRNQGKKGNEKRGQTWMSKLRFSSTQSTLFSTNPEVHGHILSEKNDRSRHSYPWFKDFIAPYKRKKRQFIGPRLASRFSFRHRSPDIHDTSPFASMTREVVRSFQPFNDFIVNSFSERDELAFDSEDIRWRVEPPRELIFSNSSGGRVDCAVSGVQRIKLTWTYEDGRPVNEVPGLLSVSGNGSLVFPPFSGHRYTAALHSATYACLASSTAGRLRSRPVTVRAVVDVPYEAYVRDQHVMAGNVAVLTCELPSYVRDYVTVTSWLRDDAFNIFPSLRGDGKYHVTRSGVLRVLSVTAADSRAAFRCRTLSTLTAAAQLSAAARIVLSDTDTGEPVAPVPSDGSRQLEEEAAVGTAVTLACRAQGFPPPTHTWYMGASVLITPGERVWVVGGDLVITRVVTEDAGDYRCVVNNTAGDVIISIRLSVTTPLSVVVEPRRAKLTTGRPLQLECRVTGGPVEQLTWYRDAQVLRSSSRVIISEERLVSSAGVSGTTLERPGVRSSVRLDATQPHDVGAYQCRAQSSKDMVQQHILVSLGRKFSPTGRRSCLIRKHGMKQISFHYQQPLTYTLVPSFLNNIFAHWRHTPLEALLQVINKTYAMMAVPFAFLAVNCRRVRCSPTSCLMELFRFLMGQFVSSHGDVISHVNISSVRVADGGLYRCMAQNTAGQVHHSARLNVYGPPTIRHMGQLTAVAGETLSVTCPVGGHPVHKITWQKDSMELPTTHRQSVHSNGTLTIAAVTRAGDEGSYSCSAYDKQGRSDTQALQIQVKVPPRLAHIHFVGENSAGLRTQASCLVLGGDTPITLSWSKDGKELQQSPNIVITQVNEFTSLLAIEKTRGEDSGNYSCTASNKAKSTTASAQLIVSVPPAWLQEPSDVSVVVGEALEVACSARGFPRPTVTWRQQTPSGGWSSISQGTGYHGNVESDSSLSVAGNSYRHSGSYDGVGRSVLTIVQATRTHEGRYLCQASNHVGSELSKLVNVNVLEPPWFAEAESVVETEVGRSAVLECRTRGDLPMTITWAWHGSTIAPSTKYEIYHGDEGGMTVSRLTVKFSSSDDSGAYECRASNAHGSNSFSVSLSVQDVPPTPTLLKIVEVGSRHISLNWSSPIPISFVGSELKYIVTFSTPAGEVEDLRVTAPPSRVEGLLPATQYSFRVAAENRVGRSGPSADVTALTLEEPPSGPPLNVKVTGSTSTSLRLQWEPPSSNLSHGEILGYHLGFRTNGFSSRVDVRPYNFTRIVLPGSSQSYQELSVMAPPDLLSPSGPSDLNRHSDDVPATSDMVALIRTSPSGAIEATLKGLRPYTRYALVLRAYNSRGVGPSSVAVTAKTLEDKPSAPPQQVSCEAVSSSSLMMTWSPPPQPHANGVVISYQLTYKPSIDVLTVIKDGSFDSEQLSTLGVVGGKANPGTVGALSALGGLAGSDVTNTIGLVSGTVVVAEGLATKLSKLKPYTRYSVTVAAATVVGEGSPSQPVFCTTLEDRPSAPRRVKAVVTGPSSVMVSWRAPAHLNGRLTHYSVHWTSVGAPLERNLRNLDPNTHHLLLENLSPGSLEVWVAAHTSVGRGEDSARLVVTPTQKGKLALQLIQS
ncbi:Immunoglobulin I-set [Trinorchestia longiramus]|nr:Immunoglobulin I-set [Trinorchestia longiramus]